MIRYVTVVTQNVRIKGWLGKQLKQQWKCNLPEHPSRRLLYVVGIIDFLSSLGSGLDPPHKRWMFQQQHVLE